MSNFSPYIYELKNLPLVTIKEIDNLFENFTFLNKPKERNTYKISLRQLIHYLIDFGIGYNSVCITTLLEGNKQQFASTMYVNRHESRSPLRPATVVDLKEKLRGAIETLISETIQNNRSGVTVVDTIYPKYIFTLDTKLDSFKLKQLTGKEYIEDTDFVDFAYSNTTQSISKITRENGYIPAKMLLLCPSHDHGKTVNETMKKSINYHWDCYLKPDDGVAWFNHINDVFILNHGSGYGDDAIGSPWNADYSGGHLPSAEVTGPSFSPSWQFPDGVECYPNDEVLPKNTIDGENVTIRFPGRSYRLFKQVGT